MPGNTPGNSLSPGHGLPMEMIPGAYMPQTGQELGPGRIVGVSLVRLLGEIVNGRPRRDGDAAVDGPPSGMQGGGGEPIRALRALRFGHALPGEDGHLNIPLLLIAPPYR